MYVFNRIFMILLCLVAITFSIIVFLLVGGVIRPAQASPGGFLFNLWSFFTQLNSTNATIAVVIFAIVVIIAFLLLIFELSFIGRGPAHFVIRNDSLGEVTVAPNSVRRLVGYEARSIPGVVETRQTVKKGRDGLQVHIRALLVPEVDAPEVGQILQRKVQKSINEYIGLPVTEVQVATQLEPFDTPRQRQVQ